MCGATGRTALFTRKVRSNKLDHRHHTQFLKPNELFIVVVLCFLLASESDRDVSVDYVSAKHRRRSANIVY